LDGQVAEWKEQRRAAKQARKASARREPDAGCREAIDDRRILFAAGYGLSRLVRVFPRHMLVLSA
ncbi:hypothetical protein, partial [Klebsiella variicola]|uniref:hypothetical protein n=1 Tax=Klebsiella variicola TaxID=244366 RepID=UPI0039C13418